MMCLLSHSWSHRWSYCPTSEDDGSEISLFQVIQRIIISLILGLCCSLIYLFIGLSNQWDNHVMCEKRQFIYSFSTLYILFPLTRDQFSSVAQSCPTLCNPMNSMKSQKDRTLKDELPRSVGAQYATGDQWRNNSRKNEGMEPKQKKKKNTQL